MGFLEAVSGLFCLIAADEFVSQLEIMPLITCVTCSCREGFPYLSKVIMRYYRVLP